MFLNPRKLVGNIGRLGCPGQTPRSTPETCSTCLLLGVWRAVLTPRGGRACALSSGAGTHVLWCGSYTTVDSRNTIELSRLDQGRVHLKIRRVQKVGKVRK